MLRCFGCGFGCPVIQPMVDETMGQPNVLTMINDSHRQMGQTRDLDLVILDVFRC